MTTKAQEFSAIKRLKCKHPMWRHILREAEPLVKDGTLTYINDVRFDRATLVRMQPRFVVWMIKWGTHLYTFDPSGDPINAFRSYLEAKDHTGFLWDDGNWLELGPATLNNREEWIDRWQAIHERERDLGFARWRPPPLNEGITTVINPHGYRPTKGVIIKGTHDVSDSKTNKWDRYWYYSHLVKWESGEYTRIDETELVRRYIPESESFVYYWK
jgi:hypothetical protein